MAGGIVVPTGVFAPGYGVQVPGGDGNVPVLWASGRTLADAWQYAMLALADYGMRIKTSFDNEGDPKSRDATVSICVLEPFAEPRLHKLGWPGGFQELEMYRLEACFGIHNRWIVRGGGDENWDYTYDERIRHYEWHDHVYDQYEGLIRQLVEEGKRGKLYRRRFQLTTWIPEVDQSLLDPPCLQRIHLRFVPADDGAWILNVNTNWRSRDGFKAAFMNMYAITDLYRLLAQRLSRETGLEIRFGRYCDISDSLHAYGKYMIEGEACNFDAAVERMRNEDGFGWNAADFHDDFVEARHRIAAMDYSECVEGASKLTLSDWLKEDDRWKTFLYPPIWDA